MTNTEMFSRAAINFQNARNDAEKEFLKVATEIEKAKGSQLYDEKIKDAEKARDAAILDAAMKYGDSMKTSIKFMRQANDKRKLTPPTNEMVNTLQVLKMKDRITADDLQSAANLCAGCSIAIDVVNDVGKAAGIMQHFGNDKEISISTCSDIINGLETEVDDFLQYAEKRIARIAAEHNRRMYGVEPKDLAKRDVFEDERGCFKVLANLSGDDYKTFADAVNGGE